MPCPFKIDIILRAQSTYPTANPELNLNHMFQVHEYLRSKLCSLYENDCIFDKFECCWNGNDTAIMTGSYNNFFRMFDRNLKKEVTYEASREIAKPKTLLKPRKVSAKYLSQTCNDFRGGRLRTYLSY